MLEAAAVRGLFSDMLTQAAASARHLLQTVCEVTDEKVARWCSSSYRRRRIVDTSCSSRPH